MPAVLVLLSPAEPMTDLFSDCECPAFFTFLAPSGTFGNPSKSMHRGMHTSRLQDYMAQSAKEWGSQNALLSDRQLHGAPQLLQHGGTAG